MPVAVVTGSNKGIGFATVRALCSKFQGDVILTSRDETRGREAVESLKKEGLNPKYHVLDICDEDSVQQLYDYLKKNYAGIDVLVNNAGIAFQPNAPESLAEQAKITLKTNYWSSKRVCETLFPLLRPGARVVNVSSSMGHLSWLVGPRGGDQVKAEILKKTLSAPDLSVETLDSLMKQYEDTTEAGGHGAAGWPGIAYIVSKIGWSALTRIQQRTLDTERPGDDVVVNHVHPGFVSTDINGHMGPLSIDRGAESSVYAALLPPNTDIRGRFIWHDCTTVDWVDGPMPAMV